MIRIENFRSSEGKYAAENSWRPELRRPILFWKMSRMSNESDERLIPRDQIDSPSIEQGCSTGSVKGGNHMLKKGPWTSAEDAVLVGYVKKYGEGNWISVQKHMGLGRCGKSCRLRWANHLRPNLEKGAFTPDEEQVIIELHAKMGNEWARMAAHCAWDVKNSP
ncbi:unnamed protein product [Musa banksii]